MNLIRTFSFNLVLAASAFLFMGPAAAEMTCSSEIGMSKAQALVRQCIQNSPATHPPCNVENSCALIRDEITRGCEIMRQDGGPLSTFCQNYLNPSPSAPQGQIVDPNLGSYSFKSPSGNIDCLFSPSIGGGVASIRCDIRQFTPTLRRVPAKANAYADVMGPCTVNDMRAFEITAGARETQTFCPTDAPISDEQFVLPYGAILLRAGITCKSETAGMTCVNPLGHGFFLSKASQRIF